MKVNICPYCKEIVDLSWNAISGPQKNNDLFWCNFCGEVSFYCNDGKEIKKPTKEALQEVYEKTEGGGDARLNSPDWLPRIRKETLKFDIVVIHEGVYNPRNFVEDYCFYEPERLLKLMYHQLGYFPSIGDEIRAPKRRKEGDKKPHEEGEFVIVSRTLANDDMIRYS